VGSIKVILSEDLEKKFREEVFKQMGMKKGNITLAIEEAIKLWIESRHKKRGKVAAKAWKARRKQKKR